MTHTFLKKKATKAMPHKGTQTFVAILQKKKREFRDLTSVRQLSSF